MKMDNQYSASGNSNWDEPTRQVDRLYNPSDVELYRGKTFVSKNGSEYRITQDGRFSGRASIEGAEVMLIAGIEKQLYMTVVACLGEKENPEAKAYMDELIFKHGQEPRKGLHLGDANNTTSSTYKAGASFNW